MIQTKKKSMNLLILIEKCNFGPTELYCEMNIWLFYFKGGWHTIQSSTSEHKVSLLSWDNQSLLKYNYINVCYEILMKDTFNWNPFSAYQSLVDTEPIIFSNTIYRRDFKLINQIIIDSWILSCGNNGVFFSAIYQRWVFCIALIDIKKI